MKSVPRVGEVGKEWPAHRNRKAVADIVATMQRWPELLVRLGHHAWHPSVGTQHVGAFPFGGMNAGCGVGPCAGGQPCCFTECCTALRWIMGHHNDNARTLSESWRWKSNRAEGSCGGTCCCALRWIMGHSNHNARNAFRKLRGGNKTAQRAAVAAPWAPGRGGG